MAQNEQGHALFTRQAGSTLPCPLVDFTGGFNDFFAAAYGLPAGTTVEQAYGTAFSEHSPALPCTSYASACLPICNIKCTLPLLAGLSHADVLVHV